jgi:isopentenyl diphosphate isomerase/L-lactate dehydrogenase-like FMN-dependent dehydrogenase
LSIIKSSDAFIDNITSASAVPFRFEELEQAAKEKIDPAAFGYIQSGAGAEETLQKNAVSFENYSIMPTYLNDVSKLDTSVELFGETYKHPFLLAPVGMMKISHGEADLAAAKAAAAHGVPFIQSTVSSFSIEEVAAVSGQSPKWFQLYWSNHKQTSCSMVERAENAGYKAIVLTIDTPMLGWRETDMKNRYSPLKEGYGKANYVTDDTFLSSLADDHDETIIQGILNNIHHPALNWQHVAELKKKTSLPILLKGILNPADAKKAIEIGIDGIIVSNHGGRQLDGVISSLDALPAIATEVNGKLPLLLDSGIRRGADVVKALALGADAVLLGRPYVYGLAIAGQAGVEHVLANFIRETRVSLALAGANSVSEAKQVTVIKEGN